MDAEMVNIGLHSTIPITRTMGVRLVEVGPGHAVSEVPFEGNGNHFGTMYAGVLFTVAEVLGGSIAMTTFDSARFYPVLKDLRINFRRPALGVVRASTTISAEEVETVSAAAATAGKADFTLHAELSIEDGTVVARTEALYQLRTHGT
ncbi:DUF4442 domain-containing protein [Pseudonocardiaceae bacterium YIM PH 21723]|nr:DUF4442 domain-containing protein [Pseudonocardiaceae bacterium YIM PH 21723]